jgi:hypothetical protein
MKNRSLTFSFLIWAMLSVASIRGQSPAPVVVQAASPNGFAAVSAATPTPSATSIPTPAESDSTAIEDAIRSLERIKADNLDTISKQEAALQRIDEMQKAANQIKIFTHRSSG